MCACRAQSIRILYDGEVSHERDRSFVGSTVCDESRLIVCKMTFKSLHGSPAEIGDCVLEGKERRS